MYIVQFYGPVGPFKISKHKISIMGMTLSMPIFNKKFINSVSCYFRIILTFGMGHPKSRAKNSKGGMMTAGDRVIV